MLGQGGSGGGPQLLGPNLARGGGSSYVSPSALNATSGLDTTAIPEVVITAPVPTVSSPPQISGSGIQGQILTATHGGWTGVPATPVRCAKRACHRRKPPTARTINVTRPLLGQRLAVGTRVNVAITAPDAIGKLYRFRCNPAERQPGERAA